MLGLFIKLERQPCLVVGGGRIAARKAQTLLVAGATLTVVAPTATPELQAWANAGRLTWHARPYAAGEAGTFFLIVGATNDPETNRQVSADGIKAGRLVNIVDVPELCNCYLPALVRRGELQIAISTGGAAPALAKHLRQELEPQFPPTYAALLPRLRALRETLQQVQPDSRRRQEIFAELLAGDAVKEFLAGNPRPFEEFCRKCV